MRITIMILLTGILSFLGIACYAQDNSTGTMDEGNDMQQQEVVMHEMDLKRGSLVLSGECHGSVGITYVV